jgi:hypothetical protein
MVCAQFLQTCQFSPACLLAFGENNGTGGIPAKRQKTAGFLQSKPASKIFFKQKIHSPKREAEMSRSPKPNPEARRTKCYPDRDSP